MAQPDFTPSTPSDASDANRIARTLLLLATLSLLLLAGCGDESLSDDSSTSGLPKEIVIGAPIGKTGYMAPYDASIAALEQLLDETNAKGGIDGHKLRIVQADTRSDPEQAPVATQQVIEDGADVLLLSGEAFTAAAEAATAEEHGMLSLSIANEPGYGPPTTGRLAFSSSPSLLSEASSAASFLHRRGAKQPFLVRDTSLIYGKAYCAGFEQTWEHLGGAIAGSADFKNEDPSIASQISKIKTSNADAVVICSYPPGGAAAIKQIRAAGIDAPIVGPSAFDGTFWLQGIPNTDEVFITSNGSIYDPADPVTGRLLEKLRRAGVDTDASSNLLATYAAGELILAAIEETETVDGERLADALEAEPHRTILGPFSYSADNHFPTRVQPIYGYSSGEQQLETKVEPQFIPEYGG